MNDKPIRRLVEPINPPPAYVPPPAEPPKNLVRVDQEGYVRVDGVLIGRRVNRDGEVMLQVCDKDHRRSAERGTRYPEVSLTELVAALQRGEMEFLTSFQPKNHLSP